MARNIIHRPPPPGFVPPEDAPDGVHFFHAEGTDNGQQPTPQLQSLDEVVQGQSRLGLFRLVAFVFAMAAIGVVAAFAWRSFGDRAVQVADVRPTGAANSQAADSQLERILREVEALQKGVEQIGAAQQQMTQRITALEARPSEAAASKPAGQAAASTNWLADPAMLTVYAGAAHKPAARPAPQRPAVSARPLDANARASSVPPPRP
jgi:hypothetical protein